MRRMLLACIAATGWILAHHEVARAQVNLPGMPQNPYVRPPVSPYLNLNRDGVPAINYFGLVRPQMQTAQQLQTLQMQQAQMAQLGFAGDETTGATGLAMTGHNAQFFNYSHYYGAPGGGVRPAQPLVSGMGVKKQ
jgi:hypothetical protein